MRDEVRGRDPVTAELPGRRLGSLPRQGRVERQARRRGEATGKREHLEAEPVRMAVAVFDVGEDRGHSRPIPRMTSTTRAAASGPVPRISAVRVCSAGSTSRIISSPAGRRSGVSRSISFFFARRRPGTDG